LIGQTTPKNKGKVSRVLAAKSSLAIRVDALGDGDEDTTIGQESRAKVEARIRALDGGIAPVPNVATKIAKHVVAKNGNGDYNDGGDVVNMEDGDSDEKAKKKKEKKEKKKRKAEEEPAAAEEEEGGEKCAKKAKKEKKEKKSKKEKA